MSHRKVIWRHDKMPFLIGYNDGPNNPYGLPNFMPFELVQDSETGVLCQSVNSLVYDALDIAYEKGSVIGPAMDEGAHQAYCDDFLSFIESIQDLANSQFLEIGAGSGYLLAQVKAAGANVLGIEPGASYSPSWARHNVDVLNTFFPTDDIAGRKFDCIASYAVLEHIPDYKGFLGAQTRYLTDNGMIFISVPDCEPYFEFLDPSCFLHEHYSYFTESTLASALVFVGLDVIDIKKSKYGGALYAAARKRPFAEAEGASCLEIDEGFGARLSKFSGYWLDRYKGLREKGKTVGVYCPSRALNILGATSMELRFFDDDPSIQGRFLPGLNIPIESFRNLLDDPVDEIWVFSYTFGEQIKEKLMAESALRHMSILSVVDVKES